MSETATQEAPFPKALERLVEKLRYRPGYRFSLRHIDRGQGSKGLTFEVVSCGYDSYHPDRGETYRVRHFFPVPPAAFDERAWRRWLLDQLLDFEAHEACEFFALEEDGELVRPFAPNHGPGRNPYSILELGTDTDARTSFRGELQDV